MDTEASRLGSVDTRFRGDLETIVGKALEKDVGRRYVSAAALAEDIELYQAHQPIGARPPSKFYLLRKFAQRHRGLVLGSALALLSLLAGLGFSLRYGRREASQRRVAEAAAYRSALGVASLQFDSGAATGVRQILEKIPKHMRGWEWEHLFSRSTPYRWEVNAYDPAIKGNALGASMVVPVVFSQDGTRVISELGEDTLGVWATESGALLHAIDLGGQIVRGSLCAGATGVAAFLNGGRLVVCDDQNGVVTDTQQLEGRPLAVSWDQRSGLLAISSLLGEEDGGRTGILWVGPPGNLAEVPIRSQILTHLSWTPVGNSLLVHSLVKGEGPAMRIFDTRSWEEVGEAELVRSALHFAAGGNRAALAFWTERVISFFGIENGQIQERTSLRGHIERNVSSVAVSGNGRFVVSATVNGSWRVWDGDTGEQLEAHQLVGIPQVAISGSGQLVAITSAGKLSVCRLGETGAQVLKGPGSYVYSVAWSPDGRTIVARDFDGKLLVYDSLEAQPITPAIAFEASLGAPVYPTWALTVDGNRAVGMTWEGSLIEFDLVAGMVGLPVGLKTGAAGDPMLMRQEFLRETGRLDPIADARSRSEVVFARRSASRHDFETDPTGRMYADAFLLQLKDVSSGALILELGANDEGAFTKKKWNFSEVGFDASFSPDGARVAIVRRGTSALIFDCSSGELLAELFGHTSVVYAVAWSPDGKRLATGSNDRTIRIWDGATYEPLAVLRGHDSYVKDVAWSPDSRSLVSASGDGTLRLWGTRSVATRTQLIRLAREKRELQRPWVASLLKELDDPLKVAAEVRAAHNLDDEQRHAALRVVRELANEWWAARETAPVETK